MSQGARFLNDLRHNDRSFKVLIYSVEQYGCPDFNSFVEAFQHSTIVKSLLVLVHEIDEHNRLMNIID